MVELSIPCHKCNARDGFGNILLGDNGGDSAFDDDSITDDALHDDESIIGAEETNSDEIETNRRLSRLQHRDLQVDQDGIIVWTEEENMVPPVLDRSLQTC
jgi:hypothetical protein